MPPTGTAAWLSCVLRSLRRPPHLWVLRLKYRSGSPTMSHVIPLRLFQILNSRRWNCNVFGWSRKMTGLNYVRNLSGGGVVAAYGHRGLAPPPPTGAVAWPASLGSVRAFQPFRPFWGAPHLWWGFCAIRSPPSACHRRVAPLMVQFPRFVVMRLGLEVVCSPKCRPIRQKAPKIGHFEAMGLHFGGIGGCKRVG